MSPSTVSPLLFPTNEVWPVLWKLAARLHDLGYTEAGVSQAMGVDDHSCRDWQGWPAHIRSCRRQRDSHPCALLAAFFLIEGLLGEEELRPLLGQDILDAMRSLDWIVNVDGKLHFRYFLYPMLGNLILTDGYSSNPPGNLDQVYHLGSDSHLLARMAPRPKVAASLDHCTGSGVQAVLAGSHSGHGFGLDINPRALDFSRLNAKLNKQDRLSFVESDCYEKVTPGSGEFRHCASFDLITANPPFVLTPEAMSLCRGGGLSGEDVTEKILRGLPGMLSPDGIFSMITNIPVFRGQTFFGRCQRWLDSPESWGMIVLNSCVWSLETYVLNHQRKVSHQSYGEHFELWLDAYESVGLEAVASSQVYLFRSRHPWRIERAFLCPTVSVSAFIEDWVATLRSHGQEGAARYRPHPGLSKILWVEGHSKAYLEWGPEYRWWGSPGVWLEGPAAQALAALQVSSERLDEGWRNSTALEELLAGHLITLVKE